MTTCSSCGKRIEFVAVACDCERPKDCKRCKGSGYVKVPLDLVAPVFMVDGAQPTLKGLRRAYSRKQAGLEVYVSHFATCPQANQHSKDRAT